ncbi:MAG: SH3 domain-containing protein [Cellulomonadaceae bacterium]|nr:SH3 domain-containing protein [Cellulomonadaceae bacterium]
MRRSITATLAVAALVLGCAACSSGGTTEATDDKSATLVFTDDDASGPDDAPGLMDTSTVLFPIHHLHEDTIDAQQQAFWDHMQDDDPYTLITTQPPNIHVGPGRAYDIAAVLTPGVELTIDGHVGQWLRIADQGGYVSARHFLNDGDPYYVTTVVNRGSDEAVDACLGGLTEFTAISEAIGKPYYAQHSYCGGELLLDMEPGDTMTIDGKEFKVDTVTEVELFSSSLLIDRLEGDILIQTCDLVHGQARVLALFATK